MYERNTFSYTRRVIKRGNLPGGWNLVRTGRYSSDSFCVSNDVPFRDSEVEGYLVFRGQKPPRVHELDTLLTLVARFEPDWYDGFIELCERATRYCIDDRYPPGPVPEYDRGQMRKDLDSAWELIEEIRAKAGIADD